MKVHILDDWFDTLRRLPVFRLLDGQEVTVWTDHTDDVDTLAARVAPAEALVLHPIVIATPHIGYVTEDELDMQFTNVYEQINAFAAGTSIHMINPDVHP